MDEKQKVVNRLTGEKSFKYVVVEVGYEYNDEYYEGNEEDYGTPHLIFDKKEEAQKEAQRLTLEMLRTTTDIASYGGDFIIEEKDYERIMGERLPKDYYEVKVPHNNAEKLKDFAKCLKISLFKVQKVEER